MHPIRTLTSWLGRPVRRQRRSLAVEHLEDRITPTVSDKLLAAPVDLNLLGTTQDLIALTPSSHALSDLVNVASHFGLGGIVKLESSSVVFSAPGSTLLQIRLHDGAVVRDAAAMLYATGLYSFVSPNYIYPPGLTGRNLVEAIPNDPQFPNQYQHAIIDTPRAWDTTFGSSSVIVAILDDGLDITHPDLMANVWRNLSEIGGNGQDNDGNGFVDDLHGWDFLANSPNVLPDDPSQDHHGTQMAGVLAARINNGLGLAGVAGFASLMPLKVIGNAATTSLTIARAVNYAVQNGAKIINSSINIDPFVNDPTFRMAVSHAAASGLLWVNSAGNLNLQNPARSLLDEMLIVGATDRFDAKTIYSNYGWGIDLMAPGGSAADPFITTVPGGYGTAWGTSVAAPLVAGTAALLWSANPEWTRDQVASAILANTTSLDAANPGFLDLLGTGRLDAGESVSGGSFVTGLGRVHGMPGPGEDAPANFNSFRIRLAGNLDPNTVNLNNFELRWAGPDNSFDTGDDLIIPLAVNGNYAYGTNSLDFQFGSLDEGMYRFTAFSGGLRDPFGTAIDGDGDGLAGGNLVRFFGRPIIAKGLISHDVNDTGGGGGSAGNPGVPGAGAFPDFNNNGNWDVSTYPSAGAPQPIADNPNAPAVIEIPISGFTRPVNYLSVMVELVHPAPADLVIRLIAPGGQSVILFANRPVPLGPPAATQLFLFADEIVESTSITPSLVTRNLKPDQALSNLYGGPANGVWRVEVADTTPGDEGLLISAAITIGEEPLFLADADGRFVIDRLPDEPVVIRILPPPGFEVRGPDKNPSFPIGTSREIPADVNVDLIRTGGIVGRVLESGAGVAGFTLYLDANGNGSFDDGEAAAVSDVHGVYEFPDLPPGSYIVRILGRPGYTITTPLHQVVITQQEPLSAGHDFNVVRDTGPVAVTLPGVAPAIRNTAVASIDFLLSEPLPELKLSDLLLTRNGEVIPLDGATLIGSGTSYSLIGLAEETSQDGSYALVIFAPAPAGQPERQPVPVATSWTLDTVPPTASLAPESGRRGVVDSVLIQFSKPVSGLDLADFILMRNGQPVSLAGAVLSPGPTANSFLLANLGATGEDAGTYVLMLGTAGHGITDIAGNALAEAVVAGWEVLPRPVRFTAVGSGEGMPPTVNVYDAAGKLTRTLVPFDLSYTGGVRVAVGDVNGDGVDDIIVAPGRNAGPRVRVYDGKTGLVISDFFVFEANFRGGVHLAAGDLTGDGIAELIVSPDKGGGPRVRVLNALTGATVADFFGIEDVNFRGGARTAVGDVTGDGRLDLIVSAGTGGGPRIAVFDGVSVAINQPTKPFGDFLAFEPNLRNGAYVTAMDLNGDGFAEIIAGAGDGGGPRVSAFSGIMLMQNTVQRVADFFAGPASHRGGVRLAANDPLDDGNPQLGVGLGTGGGQVRVYAAESLLEPLPDPLRSFEPFGFFQGGVFIG